MENENLSPVEKILFAACEKFGQLLVESERRINQTNEMVSKLAESAQKQNAVIEKLTNEYVHHIDSLTKNRDEITAQNTTLLQITLNAQKLVEDANRREEFMFEKILDKIQVGRNISESNINLKR